MAYRKGHVRIRAETERLGEDCAQRGLAIRGLRAENQGVIGAGASDRCRRHPTAPGAKRKTTKGRVNIA